MKYRTQEQIAYLQETLTQDQRKVPHGGEFDQKKSKMANTEGGGGDGHSGFDSYITIS